MAAREPISVNSNGIIFSRSYPGPPSFGVRLDGLYLGDETTCIHECLELARLDPEVTERVGATARELVRGVRNNRNRKGGLDAFLRKYDLSSHEGVVLMCLAEALLRIPDAETADRLIADKLTTANWKEHLGSSDSMFVNASTWGLMLTGRLIALDEDVTENPAGFLGKVVNRLGDPVVRGAMRQAMRIMGHQFVMGRDIQAAIKRSQKEANRVYRYSFDMLGEAALTDADAQRYMRAYADAIQVLGESREGAAADDSAPSISVKLSALFPRYEFAQRERVLSELTPRLRQLAEFARKASVALTMDAEEADRLQLSLEVFENVYRDPGLADWQGLGLAVQAYQKRAVEVLRWLTEMSAEVGRTIPVRLVKGAYWDTEIKRAQEQGLDGYPVFTRKVNTDVSYLACAAILLRDGSHIYPQFATHNAHTVASIIHMAQGRPFEFQRLHGMGEELYDEVVDPQRFGLPCRVYAPVGNHKDLLPYLVRRLLENGANTSFVNRIVDEKAPLEEIVADPIAEVESLHQVPHPRIPMPDAIFGRGRVNSRGINLADQSSLQTMSVRLEAALQSDWRAAPVIDGKAESGPDIAVRDPWDGHQVGTVVEATAEQVDKALVTAVASHRVWNATAVAQRANALRTAADRFEQHSDQLLALLVREAGKTLPDSVAELREAVDFLRYYAMQAESDFGEPVQLPGPTGETNHLSLSGRGVFVCISPWNFPLAIFTGQIAAALAAGNAVIAKPAEQTPLVAALAVRLLHEAGVPPGALNFLPGDGATIGGAAIGDRRVAGVAFTGSTETARIIHAGMAAGTGPIGALIAETGGQNAMIVDSSALPEQVVLDVVQSAFNSAGQRCSALRVLFLQQEIAPRVLDLLKGYMDELVVGDPGLLDTDVGPVIDVEALRVLESHLSEIADTGQLLHRCRNAPAAGGGTFFAPALVEINAIDQLEREVFGPVLHVIRYRARDLDTVLDSINATGFGLTLGVHSRIDGFAQYVHSRMRVGNVYVNRNMVGAVVGVQPFGGCGLSGTGPKAGGPQYLHRFATEKTLTINTSAVGGNASLLALASD